MNMKYAIVESGGKQYKAVEGGTLEVDRLPVQPGDSLKLEQVLLVSDEGKVTIGSPVIKGNPVWTKVLEHFKGAKVTIFNYSPKKRIRVKTGHRQNYTRLLVQQVGGSELVIKAEAPKAKPEKVVEEKPKTKSEAKTAPKPAASKAKPAAKPAPAKSTKPAKAEEKPAKPAVKKPATKKPAAAKKPAAKK
jgi:large subunit ribosomal protein L21